MTGKVPPKRVLPSFIGVLGGVRTSNLGKGAIKGTSIIVRKSAGELCYFYSSLLRS